MSPNFSGTLSHGIEILFFVLLLAFTIHAIVLAYHWFAYGNSKHTSLLALATYLTGGALLLLTFSFTLNSI